MDPITSWLVSNFLVPSGITSGIASLFGGEKVEATPMTPEEKELDAAAAKVDMALGLAEQASTGDVDTEGLAPEVYLLDAYETVSALPDSGLEFFGNTKDKLLEAIQNVPGAIKKVPGALIEGTADLGNVIFQGATLGQGPQLEAVIPNIMDIIKGGIGGTLVLGGGQIPTPVIGTGQTGVGRGTKVGVPNIPVIGPIITKVVGMHQQGATLGDIIKSIPAGLYDNLPEILAGATAAGLLFDEEDKETLVGLGIEPSILGGDTAVAGTADIIGGTVDPASSIIKTGAEDIVAGGVGSDIPAIKTGAEDIVAGGVGSDIPAIKTGTADIIGGTVDPASSIIKTGTADIIGGTVDPASSIIKTGESTPTIKTGESTPTIKTGESTPTIKTGESTPTIKTGESTPTIKTGESTPTIKTGPISDAELDKILTDIGGRPAVAGGYDTPAPEIKTSSAEQVSSGDSGGGGTSQQGGVRTVSGGPGDLVDIDYLFDFAGGLDQPFLTTEEEEILKGLNIYAEGGPVKKFNAVDTIINLLNARY